MNSYWYIDNNGAEDYYRTLFECKQKFCQIVNSSFKPSEWDNFVLVHYDPVKELELSSVNCRVFVRTYKDELGYNHEVVTGIRFSRPKKIFDF